MFKRIPKSVQKHAKFLFGVFTCLSLSLEAVAAGFLENTGVVDSAASGDERGYIWNSGLVQILEEAGVAVASPRSIDPKLRLHYYLAECDQLIAGGDLEATDAQIQEALLDLTGMRGLLERQARVAGMLSNPDRANTYWASVVTHPGATLDNFADAAWSYLLANQLKFGEMILELGEKKDSSHPRILLLRQLYQFKRGGKSEPAFLEARDIPSLVYFVTCKKPEIESLGGSWLYEEVCRWILRGGDLVVQAAEGSSPVMMADGNLLYFSADKAKEVTHAGQLAPQRLTAVAETLQGVLTDEQVGDWEAVLAKVLAIRKLGGAGLYLDLLEMKGFAHIGRPMKSRALAEQLMEAYPEQPVLYFEWGRLLMGREEYREALSAFEKCYSLGYTTEVLEAWLVACSIELYQDSKARNYLRKGMQLGLSKRFKQQISHDDTYWPPVRRMVAQQVE